MLKKETLQMALEGNLQAMEEICSTTWEQVYRFIYLRVQNRQEAEDITQEAYVKTLSYLNNNDINPESFVLFLKFRLSKRSRKKQWSFRKKTKSRDLNRKLKYL